MPETFQEYEGAQPARPVFLTVLCILTFIGSAYFIITGAIQVFEAEKQARSLVVAREKAEADIKKSGEENAGTRMAGKMINTMSLLTAEKIRSMGIATAVSGIFCLVGALMMWKQKKTGFYLYIFGTVAGIVSPFLVFGNSNMIAIMQSLASGFVGIVFIILYGVNFKHMR